MVPRRPVAMSTERVCASACLQVRCRTGRTKRDDQGCLVGFRQLGTHGGDGRRSVSPPLAEARKEGGGGEVSLRARSSKELLPERVECGVETLLCDLWSWRKWNQSNAITGGAARPKRVAGGGAVPGCRWRVANA